MTSSSPDNADGTITYIGHATVLIEMDGMRLITDPILRDRLWHLRRQKSRIDSAWLQDIDAILISHGHWDHLDLPSLKQFGKNTPIIAPQRTAKVLRQRGFSRIHEIAIGEEIVFGQIIVQATYAEHVDRLKLQRATDCRGYLLRGSQNIYFPGDTDLFPGMSVLAEALDIALLPVWGWGPSVGPGHMDPFRAAQALQILNPRLAIPIHWGTLHPLGLNSLRPGFLTDPPHEFARYAADLAPQVVVKILPPGSSLNLSL